MAKVIDITEKLNYEESPVIKIREEEIEVNADAATMLKIMGIISDSGSTGPKEIIQMYNLMFSEAARAKIEKFNLNFTDFTTVVHTAINLITGEGEEGE